MSENNHTLRAVVVSDKMDKAFVCAVERRVKHPVYGKIIKKTTKLHVQDKNNEAKVGDVVEIKECRPVSKTISWTLVSIVSHAE
ncbi:MAG: 30S ribosomal protein S17 [Succinivibrionaceae bacterium]